MEESIVNFTRVTCGSSNDGSFGPLETDAGVLHLMGKDVYGNNELIARINDFTPYGTKNYDIEDHFDYKALIEETRCQDSPNYFVLSDFENSEIFENLKTQNIRLIGVPVVLQCITQNTALSAIFRKEHCSTISLAMTNQEVCFTNFTSKRELNDLRRKVRMLNGIVKPDYVSDNDKLVLVANSAGRRKYESHSDFGRFPVKPNWISDCYALRHDINLRPVLLFLEDPKTYLCPVFYNLKIALYGFEENDLDIPHITMLGATIVDYTDKNCTHLVIKRTSHPDIVSHILPKPHPSLEIVNDLWLWECIATDQYLRPSSYAYPPDSFRPVQPAAASPFPLLFNTPRENSPYSTKKRKVDEIFSNITPNKKRTSAINELEGSVICNTSVSDIDLTPLNKPSKRDMIIQEFVDTEVNYVRHLEIIEQSYFDQIYYKIYDEEKPAQNFISIQNNYMIFSRIAPIRVAHQALVAKFKSNCEDSFGEILLNWIGKTYNLKNNIMNEIRPEILKSKFDYTRNIRKDHNKTKRELKMKLENDEYKRECLKREIEDKERQILHPDPEDVESKLAEQLKDLKEREKQMEESELPVAIDVLRVYVNYLTCFDSISKLIDDCERENHRFKALLKVEEAKKENQRLSLRDLMIEPVQRLPRMILLINEILSKTATSHPDYKLLSKVKEVFQQNTLDLNNKKRQVDDKVELMALLRDISGLPMDKMSAKLQLRQTVSVMTGSEIPGYEQVKPGQNVNIFLFALDEKENTNVNDNMYHDSALEIVKPRIKSGSVNSATADKNMKRLQYKHVHLIPLRAIKYVITVDENMFGITYVEPPPASNLTNENDPSSEKNKKSKKEDKKKEEREMTLKFRLVDSSDVDLVTWLQEIARATDASKQRFGLTGDDVRTELDERSLDQVIARESLGKEKSKRDIFNFAKRSMSRAFSQKQSKYPMRKVQSQFGLSSDSSGLPGSSPGNSSKYPRRIMRDSH